jgi:hypothetical protein
MTDETPIQPPSLDLGTKRSIIQLVRGPYIDSALHGDLWTNLRHNEDLVRHYLSALCLELIVDEEWGVAYVRENQEALESDFKVAKRMRLSLYETYLILHLRRLVTEASGTGQRVMVDHEDLMNYMAGFGATRSTDQASHSRQAENAISKLIKKSILRKIGRDTLTATLRRYEVTPILKLIFGPDQIQELQRIYSEIAAGTWNQPAVTEDEEEDGDDDAE